MAETISHFDVAKSVALAMLVGLLLTAGLMAMGIGKRANRPVSGSWLVRSERTMLGGKGDFSRTGLNPIST